MNQDDFKKLLDEALKPIKKQLGDPNSGLVALNQKIEDPDSGLPALNRRMDANTAAVVELESTIKGYADAYKTNKANIERLDDRVTKLEDNAGIMPPPGFTIQR